MEDPKQSDDEVMSEEELLSLRRSLELIATDLRECRVRLSGVEAKFATGFDRLEECLDAGFNRLHADLDRLEQRIDAGFECIEKRLDSVLQLINSGLEKPLSAMDAADDVYRNRSIIQ